MNFEIFILPGAHTSTNVVSNPCFLKLKHSEKHELGVEGVVRGMWRIPRGQETSVYLCHQWRIQQNQQVQGQPFSCGLLWNEIQRHLPVLTGLVHALIFTCSLWKTTDSANILTHTKSTDKLRKAVAWPLTGERVFPQVSFTPKAIGQSWISFVSFMFLPVILGFFQSKVFWGTP